MRYRSDEVLTFVKGEDSYPHSSKAFLGILAYAQATRRELGRGKEGAPQWNRRGSTLTRKVFVARKFVLVGKTSVEKTVPAESQTRSASLYGYCKQRTTNKPPFLAQLVSYWALPTANGVRRIQDFGPRCTVLSDRETGKHGGVGATSSSRARETDISGIANANITLKVYATTKTM